MTPARPIRWTISDYLRYGGGRLWSLVRAGMLHQVLALTAGVVALVALRAHLAATRDYLGAAVPKVAANKVPAGATVISQVTSTSVRFIEVPLHGASVVLGVFPRGDGLAHLGAAQSVTDTVIRDIYPVAPLLLIAWAALAIARTALRHRLFPSAATYIDKHVDRTSRQLFARPLPRAPRRFALVHVAPTDAGLTCYDWALRYGGNHGEEAVGEIVALNRYRRQPGFGSVVVPATRLKVHWSLVVPKTFGAPLERTVGDGETVATFERVTVRGDAAGAWTAAQATRSASQPPEPPEPPSDAEDTEDEPTTLPALPAYSGGPLVAARPAISPARALFALLRGSTRRGRPIPLRPPPSDTTLVFFCDPTYAEKALQPANVALWGMHAMFLAEELGRAAATIATDPARCSPTQADLVAPGLASLLATQMAAQALLPHGRVVPVRWAAVPPDVSRKALTPQMAAAIFAHDTEVRAGQLGLPAGQDLTEFDRELLTRLAASPGAEVITRSCRDLPPGLPLTALVALGTDCVALICARPITMRHDPPSGWSWPNEPDVSAFHGPWRTGRVFHVAPSRLPGNLTGPRYQALSVSEDVDGHVVALVTKGGEVSLAGDLGLADRWIVHAGPATKKRARLGEAPEGLSPLCEVKDGKLRVKGETSVDVMAVRLCGEVEERGGGRPDPSARLGVLSVLGMPKDALDARALAVALGGMTQAPTTDLSVAGHQAVALATAAPELPLSDLGALAEGRAPATAPSSASRSRRSRARRRVASLATGPLGSKGLLTIAGQGAKERLVVANVVTDVSLLPFRARAPGNEAHPSHPPFGLSLVKRGERPASIAEIASRLATPAHRSTSHRVAGTHERH